MTKKPETYPSFFEYLNARGSMDEKPKVDASGDQVDMPKPKAKDDPHKTNKKTKKKQDQVTESKKRRSFKEYLNNNGKLVDTAKVDVKGDYSGPDPKSPVGNPVPYRAANSGSAASANRESGFGDLGDKSLKYEPKTEGGDKTVSSWPKTKTEQFLHNTKNLSTAQFTKYMLEHCGCGQVVGEDVPGVTAYSTGKIHPHPSEAIKYVTVLANKNDNVLDNIVHEMKNSGSLGKLVKSLLQHPEAFSEFTTLLGDAVDGPRYAKALARALKEGVAPPIGPKSSKPKDHGKHPLDDLSDLDDDMGGEEEDEEMDDEEMPGDDLEDEEPSELDDMDDMPPPEEDEFDMGPMNGDFKMGKPPFGKGKPPMGPPMGPDDMGDEMGPDDEMGPPMGPDDMGDDDLDIPPEELGDEEMPDDEMDLDDEEMDDEEMPDEDMEDEDMPPPKHKKKSALDNLSNAMRMYSQMRR